MVADIRAGLAEAFERVDWTDDEIGEAMRRHPEQADLLHHVFELLRPTHDRMATEFVYRGHARELAERAAAGQDLRPGTAAEVVLMCSAISLMTPLNTAAAGLYVRMWGQAFPDHQEVMGNGEHYEALEASAIDEFEALARRKLAQPWRQLPKVVECSGTHHGIEVTCRYAKPEPAGQKGR